MDIIQLMPVINIHSAVGAGAGFGNDIIQMFLNAGLVVKLVLFVLMGFSVASWAIIFLKFRYFRNAQQETVYFLDLFWDSSELANIYKESKELMFSPVAQLFKRAYSELIRIRKLHDTGGPEDDSHMNHITDTIERALKRATIHENSRMDKALSFLATTGNTAPFIGLFGTVWGIMESFMAIDRSGSASLAVVAPGIAEALIATAVGLAAAIPAVIAFNYFNSKTSELSAEMETFSADFLSLVVRQSFKADLVLKEKS
ncbi:protein TolQ [Thermodesulfobacteriota bacterium]